jgi:hypothetical protein
LPTVFEDLSKPPNSLSLCLDDATVSELGKETPMQYQANASGEEIIDSDMSEEEEEEEEVDEDEENSDDEWSCQDDNLEAIVLEILGGDLKLAAQLIPVLHKSIYAESLANIAQKVGPWRNGLSKSSAGAAETNSSKTNTSNELNHDSKSNSRKRQRRPGSASQSRGADDEEEDDEEGDEEGKSPSDKTGSESAVPLPRLACPFHKLNPAKYSIHHGEDQNSKKTDYRSCAGPGFKSIQRLKYTLLFSRCTGKILTISREHLKRKHYPVQCERCYHIFPGSNRAACLRALAEHLQLPTPCELKLAILKEGISDAQWANLEKRTVSRKGKQHLGLRSTGKYGIRCSPNNLNLKLHVSIFHCGGNSNGD